MKKPWLIVFGLVVLLGVLTININQNVKATNGQSFNVEISSSDEFNSVFNFKQKKKHGMEEMLEFLDTTKEEMKEFRESGLTWGEVLKKKGKTESEFKKFVLDKHDEKWNKLVEEDWMTEKKRNWLKEKLTKHLDDMMDKKLGANDRKNHQGFH